MTELCSFVSCGFRLAGLRVLFCFYSSFLVVLLLFPPCYSLFYPLRERSLHSFAKPHSQRSCVSSEMSWKNAFLTIARMQVRSLSPATSHRCHREPTTIHLSWWGLFHPPPPPHRLHGIAIDRRRICPQGAPQERRTGGGLSLIHIRRCRRRG